jgi:hypothetical protein
MKKNLRLMAFASLLAAATLSSCNNDNDNNDDDLTGAAESTAIAAEVENFGGVAFDSIVALTDDHVRLGSGAYSNGKLTVTLNATLSSAYLRKMWEQIPSGITVSNPNVKKTDDVAVYVYKAGSIIGELLYGTAEWEGFITYVEDDVSITGSYTDGETTVTYSSANLKKGWNIAYMKTSGASITATTTAPQGAKWSYTPRQGEAPDESTAITAEVENFGSVAFDSIVALTDDHVRLGSGAYSNGKLTVTLNAAAGSSALRKISEEMPVGIALSNPDVKGTDVSVYVYNAGSIIGELLYGTAEWEGGILYVEDDVDVSGTFTGEEGGVSFTISFGLNLKKGWNIAYMKTSGASITATTTAPQGAKWSYTPGSPAYPGNEDEAYDELKVVVHAEDSNEEIVVGSATLINGELTLPTEEVSSAYLSEMGDEMPPGITVSNPDAKGTTGSVHAYKSGAKTGEFLHATADCMGILIYVDRDVSITGSYTETEDGVSATISFSLDLKKGWNIAYAQYSEEVIAITTAAPPGAEWHFIGVDYDDDDPVATPESLKAQKASAKRIFGL